MVSKEQGPDVAASHNSSFAGRTTARKVVDVLVVPLVLGAITGGFLHLPVGYWICSALAAIAGFLVGSEHPEWKPALVRGLGAGLAFGVGIIIVFYSIRNGVAITVTPGPSIGTPVVTALAGGLLTALGSVVLGGRTAH